MEFNPEVLGQELQVIPEYTIGKYIITDIQPPKNKTILDGINVSLIMGKYLNSDGSIVDTILIDDSKGEIEITFPNGKMGIYANVFRSNRFPIKYVVNNKWYSITTDMMSKAGFIEYVKKNNLVISDIDKEYEDYLKKIYLFGLKYDLGIPQDKELKVGTVLWLYRSYIPPKEGEKYGNIRLTSYATKNHALIKTEEMNEIKYVSENLAKLIKIKANEVKQQTNQDEEVPF